MGLETVLVAAILAVLLVERCVSLRVTRVHSREDQEAYQIREVELVEIAGRSIILANEGHPHAAVQLLAGHVQRMGYDVEIDMNPRGEA